MPSSDLGRSRMWPNDDLTTKSPPRKRLMVFALVGDSTMTSFTVMFLCEQEGTAPHILNSTPDLQERERCGHAMRRLAACGDDGIHERGAAGTQYIKNFSLQRIAC